MKVLFYIVFVLAAILFLLGLIAFVISPCLETAAFFVFCGTFGVTFMFASCHEIANIYGYHLSIQFINRKINVNWLTKNGYYYRHLYK